MLVFNETLLTVFCEHCQSVQVRLCPTSRTAFCVHQVIVCIMRKLQFHTNQHSYRLLPEQELNAQLRIHNQDLAFSHELPLKVSVSAYFACTLCCCSARGQFQLRKNSWLRRTAVYIFNLQATAALQMIIFHLGFSCH